jgi:ribosomal protein S14
MKKLFFKDRKIRSCLKKTTKKYFILKSIFKNKYFFILSRYKAYSKLKKISDFCSVVLISNRCITTKNKKSFNKFSLFSRFIYLKLIRNGKIEGFQKSNW